ncbi:extracellular solute-binding protein [Hyphobacterium marinum]|uniref:Extracellular solute-binding protein n=1 Tax=Hyphobacterium marinum TaxID=3116574 RepID=A0ABU7M0F8_9PROT|nr:extracellular solute-binding protein [Hyphobacterium sp. Y6023]MEE2567288.1 extracellular solute-binding protein [Hyphobacterium sp. Y6023]
MIKRMLCLGVLSAVALSACGQSGEERVVNVYTARHYSSDDFVYANFTEATGIEVNVISAGGDLLIERVRADGDRSPADVIVTVDAARLYRAEQAGLFAPTDFSQLAGTLPANMMDPQGHWIAFAGRARVIAYSTERVDPSELSGYEDLADPRWEGRLCMRSSDNAYNQSLLASIIAHRGEDFAESWATGVANNLARPPSGGDTDQITAIAAGECDAALVNHYYYARLARSENPDDQAVATAVDLFFPGDSEFGTHVNVSGAGIAANAPHPAEAREFIAYMLSDDAQQAFAELTNEFPVTGFDGYDNALVRDYVSIRQDSINLGELGEHTETAQRIFDRSGWP